MVEIHRETSMELFRELVEDAMAHQRVDTSAESAFYLVHLLDSFVRFDGRFAAVGASPDQTLAELVCHATKSEGQRKVNLLRLTGDLSLFLSGFLHDSLTRHLNSSDYYLRLGVFAYANIAVLHIHRAVGELYEELANNFGRFSDVLNEVSETCQLTDTTNLLRLYETWLKTGSERAATLLRQQGIQVVPTSEAVH